MLLTITTTHRPATDLGYLLHKHPGRVQEFPLSFGRAHVFYPEVSEERCTAALLLEIDPVGLVRGRQQASGDGALLDQYVSDRPYVASSFLSVALSQVFGSALAGTSRERPELVERVLPFEAKLAVLPCRGGEPLLRRLFEPLGYAVGATGGLLDERFPDWGQSPYFTVTLQAASRLRDLLAHLSVLVPVLDDEKHYWVGDDEVEKLLRRGGDWLGTHPERELIVRRYLRHRRPLARRALEQLLRDEQLEPEHDEAQKLVEEDAIEAPLRLGEQRMASVLARLKEHGARRVLDLGCGEGRLLKVLLDDGTFDEIVGVDVSHRALEIAEQRLKLEHRPARQRERIRLLHGSLMYRDRRLAGYDAAAVVEVIEHLDPPRLAAFERVLFEFAQPKTVVLTTPNAEYNVKWERLPAGRFRHRDHRFEWNRAELRDWATRLAARFGYQVSLESVGPEDPTVGSPTQMAVFTRAGSVAEQGA